MNAQKTIIAAAVFLSSAVNAASLYAPDGAYLGELSANRYSPDSISNPYGRYGSRYSPESINNPYGRYGSPYSPQSPNNRYANPAPLDDGDMGYKGRGYGFDQ